MSLRNVSIRGKLLALAIAPSTAALVLSGAAILVTSYFIVRTGELRDVETQAAVVAANSAAALQFGDRETADETLRSLRGVPDVALACAYTARGTLLTRYGPSPEPPCPDAPPADGLQTGVAAFSIAVPARSKDVRNGTVYLRGSLEGVEKQLRGQSWGLLAAFLVGALGAWLIGVRLQRVISGPLLTLSGTAKAISRGGDYSLRAVKEGEDEIGALVEAFNEMVTRIERRDEDLRTANRLKDEFLATLSHELRTPLNAIVGWLQLLRLSPEDPSIRDRALASLDRNARIQVRLIEDLLDVSSIASGKLRLTFAPVDLAEVVQAAIDVVRPTAVAKNLSLVGPGPSPQRLVMGDAARLEQVAWNLLSNAIKFTSPGGHVRVSLTAERGEYVVRVDDDGAGITPDFLPHVFDRFRQEDGSMTRRQGGLGVGLAIARELAERHGGRIVAASDGAGRGSVFSIFLPASREGLVVPAGPEPAAGGRLLLSGVRLLVVDDGLEAREVTRAALASAGAAVETADSAAAALAALAEGPFDALVCDLAMPGTDGFELLRLIRARRDHLAARLPAVALTAYADGDSRAHAIAAGFQAVVVKPYDVAALVSAVQSVRRDGAYGAPLKTSARSSTRG